MQPLPNNIEFEKILLNSMMCEKSICEDAIESLKPDHFYNNYHRQIFLTMTMMYQKGLPIELFTVTDQLNQLKDYILNQTFDELITIGDVFSPSSAAYYINGIIDKWQLREAIIVCKKTQHEAISDTIKGSDLIEKISEEIFRLSINHHNNTDAQLVGELVDGVMEQMEARAKGELFALQTGFEELDQATGGFGYTDLIVIAGRPSMGKTALVICFIRKIVQRGIPVALFTLEMSKNEIMYRYISLDAEVPLLSIRTGKSITQDEYTRLKLTSRKIEDTLLLIDDNPILSIPKLLAKGRKYIRQKGIKMIVIDYLQLMVCETPKGNRVQEITEITRGLKIAAKSLNVPILVLSQLSRDSEKRESHKPILSDLRDSGSIEQDADVVLFIHRDEMYEKTDKNKGKATILIGKQRNGPIGEIDISFDSRYCKFS